MKQYVNRKKVEPTKYKVKNQVWLSTKNLRFQIEQLLSMEHIQKKKLSTEKNVKDVRRACEYSPMYADVILE